MRCIARLAVAVLSTVVFSAPGVAPPFLTWTGGGGERKWSAILEDADDGSRSSLPLFAPAWFDPAPDLTVDLLDGGSLRLSEQRGKVVVLNFWASWCAPCLRELPQIQKLWESESASEKLVVAAINAGEPEPIVREAVRSLALQLPIGRYDGPLDQVFRVRSLPTLVLIDREGRIRNRWDGWRPGLGEEVAARIREILGSDPSAKARRLGEVAGGPMSFSIAWARDLDATVEGLAVAAKGPIRILVSVGRTIEELGPGGETLRRIAVPAAAGRLLLADLDADDTEEIVSYRPGASEILLVEPAEGEARLLQAPEPVLDAASWTAGEGRFEAARLALAAPGGVFLLSLDGSEPRRVEGTSETLDVESARDGSVASLGSDSTLRWLTRTGSVSKSFLLPAGDVLLAAADGAEGGVASARAAAAAIGRFGASREERQIAVATPSGHLSIVDVETGRLLWRARWERIRHVGAADGNGDGRDELIVAAGRTVALLRAMP